MPVTIATLGFPRIGQRRELKFALERYWSGKSGAEALQGEARALRAAAWSRQGSLGVDHVPSNDFSLYDHVLDMSAVLGAVPPAYRAVGNPLDTYFAMARGRGAVIEECQGHSHSHGGDLPAQEMTKWFDTNYHYVVPRLSPGQTFELGTDKMAADFTPEEQRERLEKAWQLGRWNLQSCFRDITINEDTNRMVADFFA
ncbi:MAG: hypothetical protein EON94_16195, partial [Caulobacteraceae bacterium]